MRIATWNVEWFDALFDDDGRVICDDSASRRHGVTRRQQAVSVARVLSTLDADAVMLIEAPDASARRSTVRALEGFARDAGLRARACTLGFANGTEQEISLLHDPAALAVTHDPQGSEGAPRFDQTFTLDLNLDNRPDVVTFSKPPLELACTAASGVRFRMIGVHAKSKAPHGARNHDDARRIAIQNRRKQLAQCIWLRRRVDQVLAAGEPLIVLGDLNDGPGLDEYESLFGRSGVEIVMGLDGPGPRLTDPHAERAVRGLGAAAPATARFWIGPEGRWLSALLDFVMLSPDLAARGARWRIWHPFDDAACWRDEVLRRALLLASDHFPVTVVRNPTYPVSDSDNIRSRAAIIRSPRDVAAELGSVMSPWTGSVKRLGPGPAHGGECGCFHASAFRMDGPSRVRRWALWTMRSRIASANVGSPMTSCHASTGSWLVMAIEAV